MEDILIRAGCFIAIIILGIILRKTGFFGEEAFPVLSKIVIKITLPAALVANFATMELDSTMLAIIPIGFVTGLIYIGLAYLLNMRSGKDYQCFSMINSAGYNIGSFTLPFVLSFMGSIGTVTTGLFDVGNSSIGLGVSYSCATMVRDGKGFDLKRLMKTLFTSVPFVCYIIVITLNLAHVPFPAPVLSFAQTISDANAFMAMLMIGVGFKLEAKTEQLVQVAKILVLRYGVAIIFALSFYYLLPFSFEVRKTLVLLAFSPVPAIAPAFTGEFGGDIGLSSAVNSLSIVISIMFIVSSLLILA